MKGEDLIKKAGLWWELLIITKSQGWKLLNFHSLLTPSWEDLVTSRLPVALSGVLVTKDGGHCSHKDL